MTGDKDVLTFASVGPAGIVHYTRCWACQTLQHPGGWHQWADTTDVEHAAATGQPDPSGLKCGCDCADGPVLAEYELDEPDEVSIWEAICPICDAHGECGRDTDDRPWIHIFEEEDD
jgi:hypothetical protein